MGVPKFRIHLSEEERAELERIANRPKTAQHIARRARIILLADAGHAHQDIAKALGISQNNVITLWTKRWLATATQPVEQRLQDAPRPGTPPTFSEEQVARITALACEPPENYARPITHWTHAELADEAIGQGIVASISASQVGRLLKKLSTTPSKPLLAKSKAR